MRETVILQILLLGFLKKYAFLLFSCLYVDICMSVQVLVAARGKFGSLWGWYPGGCKTSGLAAGTQT